MSFEEDFVELKDKYYREGEHDLGVHNEGAIDVVPIEFVEKYCFSRQKVLYTVAQLKVRICTEYDFRFGICTSGKGKPIRQCQVCKEVDLVFGVKGLDG